MLNTIGKLVAWFYHRLFGAADQRAAVQASEKLRSDVEREWATLLRVHHGTYHPIPTEEVRAAFDYGSATFDFDDFNIEVNRGRGELGTRVSAKSAPNDWVDLSSLLDVSNHQQSDELGANASLLDIANVLHKNWSFISSRLSSENLQATKKTLRVAANEVLERLREK
jgi:hypothetical protein